jgi:hypothetical protein
VLEFKRSKGQTSFRMRTDEDTAESFSLKHPGTEDGSEWFLMRGETFQKKHWNLIESEKGRMRPGLRATVWVCGDGSKPIVDWQPTEE